MIGTVALLMVAGIVALIAIRAWFASRDTGPSAMITDISTLRDLSQGASWEDTKALYQ